MTRSSSTARPFSLIDFAHSLDSVTTGTTTQTRNLTTETRSEIPSRHSSLSAYLGCDEAFERRSIGQPSYRNRDTVARELWEWERLWKAMSAK
jgi:hypothetical protein